MTLAYRARYSASGDQQQARFDQFIEVLNNERPHEALDMKCPAEVYEPSTRPVTGLDLGCLHPRGTRHWGERAPFLSTARSSK
jgi:hypothetical protein